VSFLRSIPLWGYFIVLGLAFLTGHLVAYRPDPAMGRGRRTAGRWGSSLLLLVGLLVVSNRNVATVLPAVLLAGVGGVISGRAAPAPPELGRREPGAGGAGGADGEPTAGPGAASDTDDAPPADRD